MLVLPTIDQIDAYLDSVEQIVVTSLSAATPDLGQVSEAINRLWQDVLRHSPQAVPASLKGLGAFEIPPPPPPPPPPKGLWENTADWVADHPWTVAGLGIGVVGAGLLVGYASPRFHRRARVGARRHVASTSAERRQVIGESSCLAMVAGSMSAGSLRDSIYTFSSRFLAHICGIQLILECKFKLPAGTFSASTSLRY